MGSFSVACNLTGISMYTDNALWIPLLRSRADIPTGDKMLFYSTALYTPIAAPVFGTLDSYGNLENIERNANVNALENYFQISIDDLISDNDAADPETGGKISGTFISRDAFDLISKNLYDEFGNNLTTLEHMDLTNGVLKDVCNFYFAGENKDVDRYNKLYLSGTYPDVEWWSDGRWGRLKYKDVIHNEIYSTKQLFNKL